jgi:hypothetical protein
LVRISLYETKYVYTRVLEIKKEKEKEMSMKKVFLFMVAMVFLICLGAEAFAQEKKDDTASPKKAVSSAQKPKVVQERTVTKTATVEAIDLLNRVVTLKDKDGNVADLQVGGAVKNLPQVKVGDQVVVKFYEGVAVQLEDPGTALGAGTGGAAERATPGEKPAAMVANAVTVVANIEAIDPQKTFVTLKGPEGKIVNVKVQDPKKLENVKVGDKVRITYTQSLAVEVKKVEKK